VDAPLTYRLDADDRIVDIRGPWDEFARANGAPELTRDRVLEHSLFGYVGDATTIEIYRQILARVRRTGEPATVAFRCDGAAQVREMALEVKALSGAEIELESRVVAEKAPPGPVGFVPAASGSLDYGRHFAAYLGERFGRELEAVPIYRPRDARRGRNAERLAACPAVYLGGGIADQLVEALAGSPALEALAGKLREGGVVAAIGAAAQACGERYRGLRGGRPEPGLGLLPRVAIEANFDPAHDRRLRTLLAAGEVEHGLGIPAGAALLVGPDGRFEAVGDVFALAGPEADLVPLRGDLPAAD